MQAQSLIYDVRLGDGGNIKARTVAVGDVLTLQVFAIVGGSDTLNNEGFQNGWGSVLSSGTGTSVGGNLSSASLESPFNAPGSQGGTAVDLNGDGFLDVGSNATSQNTDFFFARASGTQTNGARIGPNQEQFLLGTVTYTVTAAGDSGGTEINFRSSDFAPLNERDALFLADGLARNELNAFIGAGGAVVVSSGPADAFWTGNQNNVWSTDNLGATNWATDSSGATDAGVLPGTATTVHFHASGAQNLNTELGRDFSIKGLNFTANATAPVSIGGGAGNFKLTLGSGGVKVTAGSGPHTINARVELNGAQDWTIDTHSATEFTVANTISGNALSHLNKKGTGTLKLTASNTFLGQTNIHAGRLIAAAEGALGATSEVRVLGGALELGGSGNLNRINNAARVSLYSDTKLIRLLGASEGSASSVGMGQLSLSGNATLDFGNLGDDVGTLTFADFDPKEFTLLIDNWTAPEFASNPQNYTGSSLTDDRLIFNTDQSGNLAKFVFQGYSGARQIELGGGFYEIVPEMVFVAIPEASTVYICLALLALAGWRHRHFVSALRKSFTS